MYSEDNQCQKISIIIPALNEEGIVGKTIKQIPLDKLKSFGFETEIIVIDNDSTDNTAQEALSAGAIVIKEVNRGYGNAYKRGFKEITGDIIVMGDADGSHPFEMICDFIKPLLNGNFDMVVGSRMNEMMEREAMPRLHKYVGNPMLTLILNILFKTKFTDTHCGMRSIKKDSLEKLDLKAPGMEFALEMLVDATQKNLRITEIPIKVKKREAGETKLRSFRDGWRHLSFMLNRKLNSNSNK
ncbi:MAG: glycosyltransferase family 2 protein [Euryarchaeota archaeon]